MEDQDLWDLLDIVSSARLSGCKQTLEDKRRDKWTNMNIWLLLHGTCFWITIDERLPTETISHLFTETFHCRSSYLVSRLSVTADILCDSKLQINVTNTASLYFTIVPSLFIGNNKIFIQIQISCVSQAVKVRQRYLCVLFTHFIKQLTLSMRN